MLNRTKHCMKLIYKLKSSQKVKNILIISLEIILFAYIFSIPSFGERTSAIHYIIYATMILLAMAVCVFSFLYRKIKINRVVFAPLPFVAFSLVGTIIFSNNYRNWLTVVLLYLTFVVFLFSFVLIGDMKRVIFITAVSLFAFSVYFILYYRSQILSFASFKPGAFRLGSDFDNENAIAFYASVGFSSALYIVLFDKKKWRFGFIVPCLTLLLVGIVSGSRTFYLLIFVVIVVYLYFIFQRRKLIFFISLFSIILTFVGVLSLPVMSTMRERLLSALQTIFGTTNRIDTSLTQRIVFFDYGVFLGSKNALTGYGCGGFSIYSGVNTYSHSNYAETLCDFGAIGFLLFYIPLFLPVVFSYKYKMKNKQAVYTFTIFFILFGISNVFYFSKIYYLILALLYYIVFYEGHKQIENSALVKNISKIAFVCDSMNAGGAERVIANLSLEFVKKNVSTTIITMSNDKTCFYNLGSNVELINLSSEKKKAIRPFAKIISLIKVLKKERYDAVISFLPHINVECCIACKWTKIPYVVSERNDPHKDPKSVLLRILKNISFLYAHGCVFQTKYAQDYYDPQIRLKSSIILNPIKIDDNLVPTFSKNKTITAVGRLTEQKNYIYLIDSFCLFTKDGQNDYQLHIYGTGHLERELRKYCEQRGLIDSVVFFGNDPKWLSKEINSAVFALSSAYEGVPNSLLEALSAGIPCVSTDCPVGAPREFVNQGFCLEIAKLNDPLDFADKMKNCLKSDFINDSLKNRERARLFECSLIADKWLDYIRGIKIQSLF